MAPNRQQRRAAKHKGKRPGETYADVLARKKLIQEEEEFMLSPKGCAIVALQDAGLVDGPDDPAVDRFWKSFHSQMVQLGYAAEEA